jgi:hypothetical protein
MHFSPNGPPQADHAKPDFDLYLIFSEMIKSLNPESLEKNIKHGSNVE